MAERRGRGLPRRPLGGTLYAMRPLRYSINVTLDGCCDHRAIVPDEDLHRHALENIAGADAPPPGPGDLRNDGGRLAAAGAGGNDE